MYCRVVSSSQGRVRNAAQPSARSRSGEAVAGRAGGIRSSARDSTLAPKLAASIAITGPGPNAATRIPASAGPPILAV